MNGKVGTEKTWMDGKKERETEIIDKKDRKKQIGKTRTIKRKRSDEEKKWK